MPPFRDVEFPDLAGECHDDYLRVEDAGGAPSEDDLQVHRDGIAPFEMLLDKNRHGPKGAVRLDWWEATGRFEVPAYLPRVARFA